MIYSSIDDRSTRKPLSYFPHFFDICQFSKSQRFHPSCLKFLLSHEKGWWSYSWFWPLVLAPVPEMWHSDAGLGHGADCSQTFVTLHREVLRMPAYWCPSQKRPGTQQSLTCKVRYLPLPLASCDLCIGLKENETERDSKTFFFLARVRILQTGCFAKAQSRFGKPDLARTRRLTYSVTLLCRL